MLQKLIVFLFKKKVEGATEGLTAVSKTKIFMVIEGVLRAAEFTAPFFGFHINIPDDIHKLLYTLAGLSYVERANK